LKELGAREHLARDAFGAAIDVIGYLSYEELHGGGACAGCRVLDTLEDPRPRAPEALAKAGLYVYGFATQWSRIASPSVPVEARELQERIGQAITYQSVELEFEDTKFIAATSGSFTTVL
jgi:hypothetical protein